MKGLSKKDRAGLEFIALALNGKKALSAGGFDKVIKMVCRNALCTSDPTVCSRALMDEILSHTYSIHDHCLPHTGDDGNDERGLGDNLKGNVPGQSSDKETVNSTLPAAADGPMKGIINFETQLLAPRGCGQLVMVGL
eukprot:16292258-Heterocapsa_arctica.AAC.1